MKKLGCFFVLVFSLIINTVISAQNISPQFSELKGMEDAQGNTHLFYRIYSYEELQPSGFYYDNSLYHLNLANQTDTLFIRESGSDISAYIYLNDYKVINFNPIHYIFAATACGWECSPFAYNSNYGLIFHDGSWGTSFKIGYGQNPNLIYYGLSTLGDSAIATLQSNDGGQNWDTLSSRKIFMSLNPYDNQSSFYLDNLTHGVFKSSDGGITFYIADTTQTFSNPNSPEFYYDPDQNHIYRTSIKSGQDNQYYFSVSDNKGEPFSWSNKYYSSNPIFFSNDTSQSGAIYLADGKRIFRSTDYGNTFALYKELDKRIIGIYKKPSAVGGSNKLYAATKYRIFEITSDTITVIKSLPIPDELLSFYPLKVGNKWVYERIDFSIDWITGSTIIDTSFFHRTVTAIQTKPNGKQYYQISDYDFYFKQSKVSFERIDSVTGLVYRYHESLDTMNYEFVIDDLMAELGEDIISSRLYSNYSPVQMVFNQEDYFNDFGLYGKRNGYSGGYWGSDFYSLANGVGLDSVFISVIDAFDAYIDLVGCVLNGIVYGDTTLTDVENEIELPKEFSLSQNYPNPFNPKTVISYQLPVAGNVTLKVYDVLGNEVATFVNEYKNAGSYNLNFDASKLSSGVYFYRLQAGDYIETKKMILIK